MLLELIGRLVAEAQVRSHLVVVLPPELDDGDDLRPGAQPLETEALVAELPVEALLGAVLPGLAGRDVCGADAELHRPPDDGRGDEFGPVVAAQVPWRAVDADQLGEHLNDAPRANAACDVDGETLARPLVDDGEALEVLSVGAGIEDEVERPDVIACGRRRRSWPPRRHTLSPGRCESVGSRSVGTAQPATSCGSAPAHRPAPSATRNAAPSARQRKSAPRYSAT